MGITGSHIVGNSGVGKECRSTVRKQLTEILGVSFISLDALCWKAGWIKSSEEEMRDKVGIALANIPNGWVVDGNYVRRIGPLVQDRWTDMIWLDPPLIVSLFRIIVRTVLRIFGLSAPSSPGCPESIRKEFFSKESIIWRRIFFIGQ
ncbi:hypothetical protein FB451DRAFT_1556457 [Mycena latifolia]|nr:hypothetical protein FB451DRAFT_1556457 [Mycena latifolia]